MNMQVKLQGFLSAILSEDEKIIDEPLREVFKKHGLAKMFGYLLKKKLCLMNGI